ncbi:hypothetical protein [Streptomyces sp. SID3343]|uniref:hypothetical protein n=1 Tax=Streptomyces sp. SID3343 TaxID=2690260 RepID=UPI0013689D18|nr:hypothetical protein [Streptomyces sp. SID3343]MYW06209.1 hypothetical protein [Streptomyces sp. SID3343]
MYGEIVRTFVHDLFDHDTTQTVSGLRVIHNQATSSPIAGLGTDHSELADAIAGPAARYARHTGTPVQPAWHFLLGDTTVGNVLGDRAWTDIAHRVADSAGLESGFGRLATPWILLRDHATHAVHLVAAAARLDATLLVPSVHDYLDEFDALDGELYMLRRLGRVRPAPHSIRTQPMTVDLHDRVPFEVTAEGADRLAGLLLAHAGFEHTTSPTGRSAWRVPHAADSDEHTQIAVVADTFLRAAGYTVTGAYTRVPLDYRASLAQDHTPAAKRFGGYAATTVGPRPPESGTDGSGFVAAPMVCSTAPPAATRPQR